MPFTLAHPAAVLPLRRTRLDFPALVIGTMAPDFPYFVDFSAHNQFGHTLAGIFLFCLPIGLCAWFLYRSVLVYAFLALLPPAYQTQVAARRQDPPISPTLLLWVAISLILGAATHLIWDSFTHEHGAMVEHWAFLRERLPGRSMTVFKLLQFGGGGLGLLALGIVAVREVFSKGPEGAEVEKALLATRAWIGVWLGLLIGSVGAGWMIARLKRGDGLEHATFHMVTGCIAAFVVGVVILGVVVRLRETKRAT